MALLPALRVVGPFGAREHHAAQAKAEQDRQGLAAAERCCDPRRRKDNTRCGTE
jgi:hypothetical protein